MHALKSATRNVGLITLSELALKLEDACRSNEYEVVKEHHIALITLATKCLKELKKISDEGFVEIENCN